MISPSRELIQGRWSDVLNRVEQAAARSDRSSKDIAIIGVSKYVDSQTARLLFEAGCHRLGESRPQAFWEKREALSDLPIEWHFIGHLQRNKSAKTLPGLSCLHSIDSHRIAVQIEADLQKLGSQLSVLIDVNISQEADKTGVLPSELSGLLESLSVCRSFKIIGLMGMAGLHSIDPRHDFARLRQLRDSVQSQFEGIYDLKELSMGMSSDFESAIEEGATMIRVGSILFEN